MSKTNTYASLMEGNPYASLIEYLIQVKEECTERLVARKKAWGGWLHFAAGLDDMRLRTRFGPLGTRSYRMWQTYGIKRIAEEDSRMRDSVLWRRIFDTVQTYWSIPYDPRASVSPRWPAAQGFFEEVSALTSLCEEAAQDSDSVCYLDYVQSAFGAIATGLLHSEMPPQPVEARREYARMILSYAGREPGLMESPLGDRIRHALDRYVALE